MSSRIDATKEVSNVTYNGREVPLAGTQSLLNNLCPEFSESGYAVTCHPIEKYPVNVVSHLEYKNLIDPVKYAAASNNTTVDGDVITTNFDGSWLITNGGWTGTGTPVTHPAGTYTVSLIPLTEGMSVAFYVISVSSSAYLATKYSVNATNNSLTFTANEEFMLSMGGMDGAFGTYSYKLQLERGSTATPYVPPAPFTEVKLTQSGKNLLNLTGRVVYTDPESMNTARRTLTGNQIFVGISANNYLNPDHIPSYTVGETSVTVSNKMNAYGIGFDIAVSPGSTYTFSVAEKSYEIRYAFYQADGTLISYCQESFGSVVCTAPDNARWGMLIVMPSDGMQNTELTYTNLQFELGTTATAYEPYREPTVYTKGLGQDVYGGSLNWNTGVLTIDRYFEEFDGVEKRFSRRSAWGEGVVDYTATMSYLPTDSTSDLFCSHLESRCDSYGGLCYVYSQGNPDIVCNLNKFDTLEEANAWLVEQKNNGTPLTFCYKMAEPITIQLTPQEIIALSGTNILSSNAGIIEVSGKSNPVAVIRNLEDRLAALEAAVVNNA